MEEGKEKKRKYRREKARRESREMGDERWERGDGCIYVCRLPSIVCRVNAALFQSVTSFSLTSPMHCQVSYGNHVEALRKRDQS